MFNHGPLNSAADILKKCIIEDTYNGKRRCRIVCGPGSMAVSAFGRFEAPAGRRAGHQTGEFYGVPYNDAVELLKTGWPEGTAAIKAMMQKLTPRLPHAQKIVYTYAPSVAPVRAMIIDPVALMAGSPTPYLGRFPSPKRDTGTRIIKIAVNCSVSADCPNKVIRARGASIGAMIESFRMMGHTIDLTIFRGGLQENVPYLGLWNVQPAGQNLNSDQLAFALVNIATLRRLHFAMGDYAPNWVGMTTGGIAPQPLGIEWPDMVKNFDIVVDSDSIDNPAFRSVDGQLAWVKEQLKLQGIDCAE